MTISIPIIKEGKRWYVNEDNGFTKDENELVAGIPEIIETLVGNKVTAVIHASDEPFAGAVRFDLDNPDSMGGVEYSMETPNGMMSGWLCSVFFHYFDSPPPHLYVKIDPQH